MSSQIRWENISEAEVRAESENALENSGEARKIRQSLSQNKNIEEWRKEIREICHQLITEMGIDNITPDILYDYIAANSKDTLPSEVTQEVTNRVKSFLNSQFEDQKN